MGCSASLVVAGLVCVVDAQYELAVLLAGVEPVEEGGAGAADVEIACGAGSETETYFGHNNSLKKQYSQVSTK